MKKYILSIIVFISIFQLNAKNYYVSLNGNNNNSGLSPGQSWRTLSYAASIESPVAPGDIVYVKAGDYANETIRIQKNGLPGKPVSFIGYKSTPGDSPALLVNAPNPFADYNPLEMPTYTGATRLDGTCFAFFESEYIDLKNFQVKNYDKAFQGGASNPDVQSYINLYNCNSQNIGDTVAPYSGLGISMGIMGSYFSNNCTVTSCLIVNAAAEGISLFGNNNKAIKCKVYCNVTGTAATDYYFMIGGNNNKIDSCYGHRKKGVHHYGHGFSVKSNADQKNPVMYNYPEGNLITNCTAVNLGESFVVRHHRVKNNKFLNCTAIGNYSLNADETGEGTAIVIRDGASNNEFINITGTNLNKAIAIGDSKEDGGDTGRSGNNNTITKCNFYNCYFGIYYSDNDPLSDAGNNVISNCIFQKIRYMIYAGRPNAQMQYIDNMFIGKLPHHVGRYFKGGDYISDVTKKQFINCTFKEGVEMK